VETRVRVLALLQKRSMCVGALARALGITDAAVSQHLRVLRDAGLVIAERRGRAGSYRLGPKLEGVGYGGENGGREDQP